MKEKILNLIVADMEYINTTHKFTPVLCYKCNKNKTREDKKCMSCLTDDLSVFVGNDRAKRFAYLSSEKAAVLKQMLKETNQRVKIG